MRRTGRIFRFALLFWCMVLMCGVTSEAAGTKIKLNKSRISMVKGNTVQLKLNGVKGKVKWKSSKRAVAQVTDGGLVQGKTAGKCVISAVYKKKTYTCSVQVYKNTKEYKENTIPIKKNKGKILLAGSSSIARWSSAASAFSPYEIVNMAVSGSTAKQWSQWYKKMVLPYQPEVVVWYVGGNDLWKGKTPAETAKQITGIMLKIRKALPNTQIYFVSVAPNVKRKAIAQQIVTYNKKVKQFCGKYKKITYIDLASHFPKEGAKLSALLEDGLHPNKKGYKIWNQVVGSKIRADLDKKNFGKVTYEE